MSTDRAGSGDWRGLLAVDLGCALAGLALSGLWRAALASPQAAHLFAFLGTAALLLVSLHLLCRRGALAARPEDFAAREWLGAVVIVWALSYPFVLLGVAMKAAGASRTFRFEEKWAETLAFLLLLLAGTYGVRLALVAAKPPPPAPGAEEQRGRGVTLLHAAAVNAHALVVGPAAVVALEHRATALAAIPFLFVPRLMVLVFRFERRSAALTLASLLVLMAETAGPSG